MKLLIFGSSFRKQIKSVLQLSNRRIKIATVPQGNCTDPADRLPVFPSLCFMLISRMNGFERACMIQIQSVYKEVRAQLLFLTQAVRNHRRQSDWTSEHQAASQETWAVIKWREALMWPHLLPGDTVFRPVCLFNLFITVWMQTSFETLHYHTHT